MAEVITRPRKIRFSALDISAHPHPPGVYHDLLKRAVRMKRPLKLQGNEWAALTSLMPHEGKNGEVEYVSGSLHRFTKIDLDGSWFDANSGDTANDSEIESFNIPAHLNPNDRVIDWVFFIEPHILVFVRKNGKATISPDQIAKFFGTLLNLAAGKIDGVDVVEVTTIKDHSEIERIFKNKTVATLSITLKKPNADSPSRKGALAKISKTMDAENSQKWTETLKARDGQSLVQSERIEELMDASETLGSVKATTFDENGVREDIDTKDTPLDKEDEYDPKGGAGMLAFVIAAGITIVMDILKRRK